MSTYTLSWTGNLIQVWSIFSLDVKVHVQ
uniref:Uncharacterized protein n=1 Tax=Anguilla anguilla TaxID=7936 RepID=A0A0E9TNJ3_ANGAN